LKKPVKVRRRWAINPKTRVEKDGTVYDRRKIKKETKRIYEQREDKT